jgi:hypothetical protein
MSLTNYTSHRICDASIHLLTPRNVTQGTEWDMTLIRFNSGICAEDVSLLGIANLLEATRALIGFQIAELPNYCYA